MTTSASRSLIAATFLAPALILGGCATDGMGNKQTMGTILGAAAGAWAGSSIGSGGGKTVATAAGTLLGAYLGGQVGRSMDEVDRMKAAQAQQQAFTAPIGETIYWNNRESGNSGQVAAVRDGTSVSGDYCREFRHEMNVSGETASETGTACRDADGTWRILK